MWHFYPESAGVQNETVNAAIAQTFLPGIRNKIGTQAWVGVRS